MDLKRVIRRFVPMRWQRTRRDEQLSIVLLLRKPHFFTAEQLRIAAERAWGISFREGGESSMHCVVQSGGVTMMKAGPHLLNLFHHPKPYIDNPGGMVDWLPQASQRHAWVDHSAFVGVDYLNYDVDVDLAYAVLSGLVAEMLDENCTGIYAPRESSLGPNDGSLYSDLRRIALSRDSGVGASS
jgi:hypothetical protein